MRGQYAAGGASQDGRGMSAHRMLARGSQVRNELLLRQVEVDNWDVGELAPRKVDVRLAIAGHRRHSRTGHGVVRTGPPAGRAAAELSSRLDQNQKPQIYSQNTAGFPWF